MKRLEIKIGEKFGRLTIIKEVDPYFDPKTNHSFRMVECLCVCGNRKKIRLGNIRNREAKSCGCYKDEIQSKRLTTHGESSKLNKTPEFNTWLMMRRRCYHPYGSDKKLYQDRGIIVCDKWLKKGSGYINFLKDVGRRPSKKHSIDRINNNGNYEPGNVRWATMKEQNRNKRNNFMLKYNGKKMCLADWMDLTGINQSILWQRIKTLNWSIEKALTTPVNICKKKKLLSD